MKPVKGLTPEEQRKLDEWFIENTTKGLEHVDTLREAFAYWRRRGRGAQLVGREAILADHFDRLFHAKIFSEEHWFTFLRQLLRTAEPDKISLSDAILSVWAFDKSWEDIRRDVAANYPGSEKNGTRWTDRRWQQERKKFSEL